MKQTKYLTIIFLITWVAFAVIVKDVNKIAGIEFILPAVAIIAAALLCISASLSIKRIRQERGQMSTSKRFSAASMKILVKWIYLVVAICWMTLQTINALVPSWKGISETTHTILGLLVLMAVIDAFWPRTERQE